jgi:hypothetical protein
VLLAKVLWNHLRERVLLCRMLMEVEFQAGVHRPEVKVRLVLGKGGNSKLGGWHRGLHQGSLMHVFVVVVEKNSGKSPDRILRRWLSVGPGDEQIKLGFSILHKFDSSMCGHGCHNQVDFTALVLLPLLARHVSHVLVLL